MNLNQLLPDIVVALPVLLLLSFAACAFLISGLKKQVRDLAHEIEGSRAATDSISKAVAVLDQFSPKLVEARLTEIENRKPVVLPEPSSPAFVGTSRRGQGLRLARSGETPAHIAETLGVSQGEVNLTLKLQDLFSPTVQ